MAFKRARISLMNMPIGSRLRLAFAFNSLLWQTALIAAATTAGIYSRTLLGPTQEAVRLSLGLSDQQMAFVQGPAMAIPLAASAIPLGYLIDRNSRVKILICATLLGLAATILTATVSSFWGLFFSRCIVGFSAPASLVAAYSLLADLYPAHQRGRATMAMAIAQQAIGAAGAFYFGGWLLGVLGIEEWRSAMLIMAIPQALLLVAAFGLQEPARQELQPLDAGTHRSWRPLWDYRSLLFGLMTGMAVVNLVDGAALIWAAPALTRTLDLQPEQIGAIVGLSLTAGGIAGPLLGGMLADRCQMKGGPRRTLFVLSGLTLLSAPLGAFAIMPTAWTAGIALALFLSFGPVISVMTTAVCIVAIPNEFRGKVVSLKICIGVIFGLGLAPPIVSASSGALGGEAMLGVALALICSIASVVGAVAFLLGARAYPTT